MLKLTKLISLIVVILLTISPSYGAIHLHQDLRVHSPHTATFDVPLAKANIGEACKRIPIQVMFSGTLPDNSTLNRLVVPGRVWTLKSAHVASVVRPNSYNACVLTINKVSNQNPYALNTPYDLHILPNIYPEAVSVPETTGAANEILEVTVTTTTQTTAAQDVTVVLEIELDDSL